MQKHPSAVCVLLLCLLLSAACQSFADSNMDEGEIEHILDLFEKAYLDENMELLASLLSDQGYIMVMTKRADPSVALVLNKNQIVQSIAHRLEQVDYLKHKHIDRRIRIDGPAATSISTIVDRLDTGQTQRSRVYHIYAREEQGWKIVFSSDLLTGQE